MCYCHCVSCNDDFEKDIEIFTDEDMVEKVPVQILVYDDDGEAGYQIQGHTNGGVVFSILLSRKGMIQLKKTINEALRA